MTSAARSSSTRSAGLEDGPLRSASQGGPQLSLFGPEAPPASRSQSPGLAVESTTPDTSGLPSSSSSKPADLRSSWESRLQALMEGRGSTLYALTWRRKATPSGRPILQLRASAPRTSGSASTSLHGWGTPTAEEPGGTAEQFLARKRKAVDAGASLGVSLTALSLQAQSSGWPTPTAALADKALRTQEGAIKEADRNASPDLMTMAVLSGWARPAARDHKDTPGMATEGVNPDGSVRNRIDQLPRQAMQVGGWPTPRANENDQCRSEDIAAAGSSWLGQNRGATVATMVTLTAHGPISSGSHAGTERPGQLNAAFPRWLQGYPEAWDDSAPGSSEWQKWQALTASPSSELRPTEPDGSKATETP